MAPDFNNAVVVRMGGGFEAGFDIVLKRPPLSIKTLKQVHGNGGAQMSEKTDQVPEGDWLWTSDPNCTIGIMVADCTAILLAGKRNTNETFVAGIHAGWRGTAKKIIECAFQEIKPLSFKAWLSPSICQEHFEVGEEVLEALGKESRLFAKPSGDVGSKKFFLDLKKFQLSQMQSFLGASSLCTSSYLCTSSSLCTYCQPEFISYRQSGPSLTGRHLAWIRQSSSNKSRPCQS